MLFFPLLFVPNLAIIRGMAGIGALNARGTGLRFLDLFAGAGGLSEGFIRAGFSPVAHIEADLSACFTLRTRMIWHWLESVSKEHIYEQYLKGELDRPRLYEQAPEVCIDSVIYEKISKSSLRRIFRKVDSLLGTQRIDLIIGGPPCQAYSVVGRSRDKNRMLGDERNNLYYHYASFLRRYKPDYFAFENVTGLLSARDEKGRRYIDKMLILFRRAGYETEVQTLSAEHYGVLQSRKRVFLIGKRGNRTGFFPKLKQWDPGVKVKDALLGLPPLKAGEGGRGPCQTRKTRTGWLDSAKVRNEFMPVTCHQARPNTKQDLDIYRRAVALWNARGLRLNYNSLPERLKTHRHRNSFIDRFKVVASNLPCSHTIVAHIAKDGHYYIHPDIRQNRSITPREAARIQTFPDDYYFESTSDKGWRTSAFRQIGNAVPVLLAEKLARGLREAR